MLTTESESQEDRPTETEISLGWNDGSPVPGLDNLDPEGESYARKLDNNIGRIQNAAENWDFRAIQHGRNNLKNLISHLGKEGFEGLRNDVVVDFSSIRITEIYSEEPMDLEEKRRFEDTVTAYRRKHEDEASILLDERDSLKELDMAYTKAALDLTEVEPLGKPNANSIGADVYFVSDNVVYLKQFHIETGVSLPARPASINPEDLQNEASKALIGTNGRLNDADSYVVNNPVRALPLSHVMNKAFEDVSEEHYGSNFQKTSKEILEKLRNYAESLLGDQREFDNEDIEHFDFEQ